MPFILRCLNLPAILALLPATAQTQLGLDLLQSQRNSGWLSSGFEGERRLPGDTIVVPEDVDRTTWTRVLKDWGQILYQMGLGVAALKVIRQ